MGGPLGVERPGGRQLSARTPDMSVEATRERLGVLGALGGRGPKALLTVVSLDLVTIFGPGALQYA